MACSGKKDGPSLFVSPHSGQSATRRAEEGVVTDPPFPGSWTLFKSQDRLRPRGLTSRPGVCLLQGPRSEIWGPSFALLAALLPCDVEDCPGRPDIENEVHLLARSKGLRNPEPLWGSGFRRLPCSGQEDGPSRFRVPHSGTKCGQESRRGSSYRSPIPWILDPLQEPRPSPAARADLAAGGS